MELRPTMLDELGLLPTLDWFVTQYTKLTEVRVMLDPVGVDQRFPPEVETSAYRIFQEALTNVARHAGVDQAKVTIQLTGEDLVVRVEDQGVGFNPTEISALASSGLSGMRERARLLGGQLNLDSAPGQGTRLTARLPVKVKT
jgi:signal transduction histidine kinase